MSEHFNVLIVGAGSAGCVLANRLSTSQTCSVGLVEAGDVPQDPDILDPRKWPALSGRDFDWSYTTEAQPFTANRRHEWPRGKVLGGSSCLHAMAYVRGHPHDYLPWQEAAGESWTYEAMLPAFRKSEAFSDWAYLSDNERQYRGADGPLDVLLPDQQVSPVTRAFMAAGRALGVPGLSDHNNDELIGYCPNSLNIRNGQRLSLAEAYLSAPVLARENLHLLLETDVDRLVTNPDKSASLQVSHKGQTRQLTADRIILCAGAIGTPLLLMRSGTGPADTLSAAGINCTTELPDVGCHLQDHLLGLSNLYRSSQIVPESQLQHSESLMYLNADDFSATAGRPDIVVGCVVAPSVAPGLMTDMPLAGGQSVPLAGSAFSLLFGFTSPTSRGRLRPSGPGRDDPPIIDPAYLSTEHDRLMMRKALIAARKLGNHEAMATWRDHEVLPGSETLSELALDEFCANAASTHHHPCGTCRMGISEDSVVDESLKLRGHDNVYIVDASVFPSIPSGPINATVVAVAEHWAENFSQ